MNDSDAKRREIQGPDPWDKPIILVLQREEKIRNMKIKNENTNGNRDIDKSKSVERYFNEIFRVNYFQFESNQLVSDAQASDKWLIFNN